jgi:nicotinamide-nucleotide amidase
VATVEIIAIGDELLSGETVDTNSSFLDAFVESRGHRVLRHVSVPDDEGAIAEAFREAASRTEVVLSTGGLGPTQDDVTMGALARALGCELRLDEPTLAAIRDRYRSMNREMSENNIRQAMVPEVGEVIENRSGTAPAFTCQLGMAKVFILPGVPREVRWLVAHQLPNRLPVSAVQIWRRTIKVMGVGESQLETRIREVIRTHPEVRFGFRTSLPENHVKLFATGVDAQQQIQDAEEAVRAVLGLDVFGADDDALVGVLFSKLQAIGRTVAVAESCTGGRIQAAITSLAGSSEVFRGGVVAYSNDLKKRMLGVRPSSLEAFGAVSEEVASEMAAGVRSVCGADYGLSVTGVAGPEGGSSDKPLGTVWLGFATATEVKAHRFLFPGDRELIQAIAAGMGLDLLRRELMGVAI